MLGSFARYARISVEYKGIAVIEIESSDISKVPLVSTVFVQPVKSFRKSLLVSNSSLADLRIQYWRVERLIHLHPRRPMWQGLAQISFLTLNPGHLSA
jgi:hypothetical protein